jgi:hypothetical protein
VDEFLASQDYVCSSEEIGLVSFVSVIHVMSIKYVKLTSRFIIHSMMRIGSQHTVLSPALPVQSTNNFSVPCDRLASGIAVRIIRTNTSSQQYMVGANTPKNITQSPAHYLAQ